MSGVGGERVRVGRAIAPLAAVALVAAGIAAATTRAQVHVPPRPLALLGAAIVAGGALLVTSRARAGLAAGVGAGALGAAAGHILLAPGVPRVHDLMHFWGVWAYGRCVHEGVIYPQWMPYIGAGMPLLPSYGPLNFLLALPGIAAGLPPLGAWKLEMLGGHVLSALSMLAAARLAGAGWRAALLGAGALAFAPWRLAVFGYRGALGEANSFVFLPLLVAATLRMLRQPTRAAAILLALSTVGLMLTHAMSALCLALALLPLPLLTYARGFSTRLGRTALAGAWGLALAAFWWVPVLAESSHTSIRETTADNVYYRYQEQGVDPSTLFARVKWDQLRGSVPESLQGERESMPFYTGAVLMLLCLTAFGWSRSREAASLSTAAGLGLLLSTSWFAWVADWLPALETLRFPWRFLSVATVCAALALALAFEAWSSRAAAAATPLAIVLLGLLVWDGSPYTGSADRFPAYEGAVHFHAPAGPITHVDTEAVVIPLDLPQDGAVRRVRNLDMPPNDYRTSIDWFYPGYYEWFTPVLYRDYWRSPDPARAAEAGVVLAFSASRREPRRLAARPYVSLEAAGRQLESGATLVERRPGSIRARVDVPAGGATLVVLEQRFPGWWARVDGGPRRETGDARGFLAVDLPPGVHDVALGYGWGTLGRKLGALVSLLAALGGAWVLLRRRG